MNTRLEAGDKIVERKLTVLIPASEIDSEVESRILKFSREVHLRGFRPGKAKPNMVRQQYGAALRREVIGDAINKYYGKALEEHKVMPVGMPAVDITKNNAGEDVEFVAVFEVIPEVEVKGLDQIEVERVSAEVTDKDVEEVIDRLRRQHATFSAVDRAAKNGDKLTIDFEGFMDGEAFPGGTAKDFELTLGDKRMIAGFEDGLLGAKAGDELELNLNFPEEYHAQNLAGKPALFKVKVTKVEEPVLAEVNEEFAKNFKVDSVEALYTEVKTNMARELEKKLTSLVKEQVMAGLVKHNEIELPRALVEHEIQSLKEEALSRFGMREQNGKPKMDLPGEIFRANAENRVRLGVLVGELIKKFDLKVEPARVEESLKKVAAIYEDPEEVIREYKSNRQMMSGLEAVVLEEMVVEKVLEHAKVSEKKKGFFEVVDRGEV